MSFTLKKLISPNLARELINLKIKMRELEELVKSSKADVIKSSRINCNLLAPLNQVSDKLERKNFSEELDLNEDEDDYERANAQLRKESVSSSNSECSNSFHNLLQVPFQVKSMLVLDKQLALGTARGQIFIYSFSWNQIESAKCHKKWIESLVKFGDKIASASYDGTVKIWSLNPITLFKVMDKHLYEVTSLLSLDGIILVSGGNDNNIITWNTESNSQIVLKGHKDTVTGLSKYKQGNFVSVGYDKLIKLWSSNVSISIKTIQEESKLSEVCLLDNNLIAVGTHNSKINVWDVDKVEIVFNFEANSRGKVTIIIPISSTLIATACGKAIQIWSTETSSAVKRFVIKKKINKAVLWRRSSILITDDNNISIWDY